ncbi:bifunctional 2-polyprenyl-6-hydroxyphenol methylase/3-demethylubiquinol 3-O-methyltransferase UbiG [Janibacter sp. HTCC2649]|uniref:class I SAM-dependent methyltransferase n=1 Tax=Janibacter sp. HTCC2649 TaxID=313589 RepID=UPI000323FE60|nr:class I SAM-dependent methyltransferase [Janibacter sp. HTCC2649]
MSTEPRGWQAEADRLANASVGRGDPTGWFEELYAAGESGEVTMAWDHDDPQPLLADWTHEGDVTGAGLRALVVGCGLGAEAEHLAALGFATTAFDLSPTAIRTARSRHPGSSVDYQVADLLDPPREWHRAFDLVVEIYTVQAVPRDLRDRMISAVSDLVASGGTLLAIQAVLDPADDGSGPPWPLTREEIESFVRHGLTKVAVEELHLADTSPRWRAEFVR